MRRELHAQGKLVLRLLRLEEIKERNTSVDTQGLRRGGGEVKTFCLRKVQREGPKQKKPLLKCAH